MTKFCEDLTLIMPAKNELPCMDYVLSGLEKINSDINVLILLTMKMTILFKHQLQNII